jgi:AraC-like DNA-binding protein
LTVKPVEVSLEAAPLVVFESRHAPSFSMEIDTWPFEKLCFVRHGKGMIRLPSEGSGAVRVALRQGDLVRVPADRPHAFTDLSGHPMTLTMACYDERLAGGNAQAERLVARYRDCLAPLEPVQLGAPHPRSEVTRRFRQLLFDASQQRAFRDDALWCGVMELMHHITVIAAEERRLQSLDPAARGFAQSLAYLKENFIRPIRIEQLAAIANLSYRRYTQRFRQETGATVVEYVTSLRLDFASQRLRETGNIMLACFDAGFGDLSSFYRAFKRAYAITPKQFVKSLEAGDTLSPA